MPAVSTVQAASAAISHRHVNKEHTQTNKLLKEKSSIISPLPATYVTTFTGSQHILYKLCTLVCKCLCRAAPYYLINLCIPVSATTARSRTTFVLMLLLSDYSVLSTVMSQITQFCCLRSCSLELPTSSHSRPVFVVCVIFSVGPTDIARTSTLSSVCAIFVTTANGGGKVQICCKY